MASNSDELNLKLYKPKLRSKVWKYFQLSKVDTTNAYCNICNGTATYKLGSTGGLSKHLERKHKIFIHDESTTTSTTSSSSSSPGSKTLVQPTLEVVNEKRAPYKLDDHKALKISIRIGMMICKDLQPISIVEDRGFKELISHLDPK